VARVLGLESRGHALVAECREKLAAVRARVDGRPRPSVVCLEWIEPVFTMGNWGPEIVDCAGGESLLGRAGKHSTTTPWDAVRAANPDVLVIAPCGFGIDRTMREMPRLRARPGWSDLAAVRAGRVFVADGNLHFNRSSPTLFDTPAMLAEMLHPEAFPDTPHRAWWCAA
jgi:iron complex transport system substrate-binding protein